MRLNRTKYMRELRSLIDQRFSLEEIQVLCFDLGVDYGHLAGDTKPFIIHSLLIHLAQRGRLNELANLLFAERPGLDWPELPPVEQQMEDARMMKPLSAATKRDEDYQIAKNWDGETSMRGFDLSGRNLSRLILVGVDLTGAKLRGTDLFKANLSNADLNGADLHRANLWGANLSEARLLDRPNLFHADLSEANLRNVRMLAAILHGANLCNADLRQAKLPVDFSRADLQNADLCGADLTEANLYLAIVRGARYSDDTKWPNSFDPLAAGAILVQRDDS